MDLRRLAFLCLFLCALMPMRGFGSISVAVKRGQTEVDPKTLPYASFTITMEHGALPLQKIVLTDVATGKDINVWLESSFSSKIEYLTATEGRSRVHAQIILALKPGDYEFKRIEFNPSGHGRIGDFVLYMANLGHFRFKVYPGVVSYCGSLDITTDWGANFRLPTPEPGRSVTETVAVSVKTEATQKRDVKWAFDVVPAMRTLPSVVSSIVRQ